MGDERTDLPPEDVITRLGDADFLKNHCEFAALYRPSIVTILFARRRSKIEQPTRACW